MNFPSAFFLQVEPPTDPQRIVLIRPCCIGDVVMATAALSALRDAYPNAHITWAVGEWSRAVLHEHPMLDAILNTGSAAHPVQTWSGFQDFVKQLRDGHFDLAVSLVRSVKMSAAVRATGIPHRAGLDSNGRGFGYNIRAAINPTERTHEVDVYLRVIAALGIDISHAHPIIPLSTEILNRGAQILAENGLSGPFLVVNPAGGSNPGTQMAEKRYPPDQMAQLVNYLCHAANLKHAMIVAGPDDGLLIEAIKHDLFDVTVTAFPGTLTFPEIGALARLARVYIGNDTGLTHYAAATGAKTVMILGPSDPARYGPYTPNALALWRPYDLPAEGVSHGAPTGFSWVRHGISVEEAGPKIAAFLQET